MSALQVEKHLNKARSLFTKGKEAEANDLLNSIIKKFPQNKKVQFVIQQLKQLSVKQSNPSQQKIDTLLKYYQNSQMATAENLALSLTQEFPNHPFGWKALGVILGSTGKKVEALIAHQKAIKVAPEDAEIHNNLGNALRDLGKFDKAEVSIMKAIKIKPDNAGFYNNLGALYKDIGKLEEAETNFRHAIRLMPELAISYNNLGLVLLELRNYEQAQASYTRAIELNPGFDEAYSNLADVYRKQGLTKETLECISKAVALKPENPSYRWSFAMLQIPKVFLTIAEYKNVSQIYEKELSKLESFITPETLNEFSKFVGTTYPYYIAYLENNNRFLLEKHGEICCHIMKNWQEKNLTSQINLSANSKKKGKIKVGIISSHIHYHSVWNMFLKGVIKNLDADKFDIHIFYLKKRSDDETELTKKSVKYFHTGFKNLTEWANKIKNSEIDIAFYPEVGMHKLTIKLASMRLAPIQVASFGHPETSGLNTLDYYISSELLETSNSNSFYSEKLIKLPGLGYYFEPPTLKPSEIDFSKIGINLNSPIFLCLGAPNKFLPLYDWVFVEIIRRINNCQLVFVNDLCGAFKVFKKRLKDKIEHSGFIFEKHVIFVPGQTREGYSALMKNADLLLDTIGFSGANTALQAIGCGLPVITREGRFQRTRHASAILRTIDVEELIANTEEEYIDLIEKITLDEVFKNKIRFKIKAKEKLLYKNENSIRALEDFFESVGGR